MGCGNQLLVARISENLVLFVLVINLFSSEFSVLNYDSSNGVFYVDVLGFGYYIK